ncbi:MAG: mandelate racemase/muconate lactonizing enzyme family protein [Verrucomicrobia bacterium]|nr:mandelate racemase/muconate lactonizing enzyme family protein [Verrucomicrobiota bacterium]
MKITNVEAIYVSQKVVRAQCDSGQDALIVKVSTDAGITGIGEVDSAPLAAKAVIEGPFSHTISTGLKHLLIGQDPFETERLWHQMYHRTIYSGRRGIGLHAMSGIDLALWDIKGKALGLPVWKLLGGGFQKQIRCYASSLFGATPKATGELAKRIRAKGFSAVKFGWAPMGTDAKTDVDLVRQARKGFGTDGDVMIDAGLVWDARTAIQRAKAFAEFGVFWLEEPLPPDDYEGYAKLTAASPVHIAAGEQESGRQSFLDLMDKGRVDIAQVDLTRCGGFTEAMKIASLAADRGLKVANHGFSTYINVHAALHWLNAIPNALIAEFVVQENTSLREFLTKGHVRMKDGHLPVPDAPGLGLELDEEQVRKHRVA